MRDVMSTQKSESRYRESLREHNRKVDHACRAAWGISVKMWRVLDQVVSLGALALAGYAIAEGAEPVLALLIAAVIISGPKVVEWWLVREDFVEFEEMRSRRDGKE
ncbi:hypothetical protein [Natrinema amylolyticum]|uniref:hypothetical protein n=1 Tax=Natrinema amylolyticum TaxID=2878679 RepID=UPI001CFB989E|nr:hypothetical protein [Natrinema amylolyticum]